MDEDVRLTLLLRDAGKVTVVSKGGQRLRSKLKGVQEPFSSADYQIYLPQHGSNGRLGGGRLIESFSGIRTNVMAFSTAARCVEVVDMMLPFRAPSPDVFDILHAAFQALASSPAPDVEWIHFVRKLLNCLGHGDLTEKVTELLPNVERCRTFVDAELERVLPWPLKSEVFAS